MTILTMSGVPIRAGGVSAKAESMPFAAENSFLSIGTRETHVETTMARGLRFGTKPSIDDTANTRPLMHALMKAQTLPFLCVAVALCVGGVGCSADANASPQVRTIASPAVVSTDSEPAFDAAVHQLLLKDEFDTYQTFAKAVAGGWRCSNRSTVQDVTTNPEGACRVISEGYDSIGRAIRLVYDGKSNGAGQEAHAWGRPSMPDNQAGRPGKTFYMSYYFRITPGRGALDDPQQRVQVKWLELWRTDESDRAQFSTAYSFCTNGLPETLWNFYARAAGAETCQGGQVRPPFAKDGAGAWHRATHKYVTQSAPGARDGIGQMWIDGTLILSVAAGYCGVAVPNNAGVRPQNWCENADLDSFFTNEQVKSITLGGVMTGPLWPFTIDWDHVTIWRDR